jgi:murein DD-endopeptidase MepM/ murein hydrolase activator NlpD
VKYSAMINTFTDKRRWAVLFACITFLGTACSTSQRGLFTKKTAHEQYAGRITEAGLAGTALGSLWFAAAEKAMTRPLTVSIPYKETGYFAAEQPGAAGYLFTARRGEQLQVNITAKPAGSLRLFADLWKPAEGSNKPNLLVTADTATWSLQYEVEGDGRFLLRLQPELLRSGEYTVTITTAASLAFPVPAGAHSRVGSFWGDNRDGGARSHEGIDIFGKFRTPVIAAANGYINSTRENNLGGKVVFLRPEGKSYTLYYAHLDSQLVKEGQQVAAGDTLGLMGNTGNARNTPTHLHFGIYTSSGAVDPMPFVNKERPAPAALTASTDLLTQTIRNTTTTTLLSSPAKGSTPVEKLPVNSVMQVWAATGNWYKVALPDNREGFIERTVVSAQPYKKQSTKEAMNLLDAPIATAATKTTIPAGSPIAILGNDGKYQFINFNDLKGWIQL